MTSSQRETPGHAGEKYTGTFDIYIYSYSSNLFFVGKYILW